MSMFPDYYNFLCKILPPSVFLPSRDEGLTKETVALTLIIEAHRNGLFDLSNELQYKLHPEIKDLSLTVMKHRLSHLVEDAENDPMSKIQPACPYEASWIRNRGNNPGFKAWREKYDETCSSYKGNAKTGSCKSLSTGDPKGTNVRQNPTQFQKGKNITKNSGGSNYNPSEQAESGLNAPIAVSITPNKVLGIIDEVFKLGLEAPRLQRLKLIREQLGKLKNSRPIPLMDVKTNPATITSGALTSHNQSHPGKRDHFLDGQEKSKCMRNDTGGIQAGVKHANQGNTNNQAVIHPNINEESNKVPNKTKFGSTDLRYHREDSRQTESSLDRDGQSRETTVQGGSSQQSQLTDQVAQLEEEIKKVKGNWRCQTCKSWNVSCSKICLICHINQLRAQLGLPKFPRKN